MKTNRPATEGSSPKSTSLLNRKPFLTFMLVLLAVLVWLFRMAFHPDYVVFSNDGPLGLNSADYNRAPAYFTGIWCDLNWLGLFTGSAAPGISGGLNWLLSPFYLAKFYAFISLAILGGGAWFFFRQLGLGTAASFLGGLATALLPDYFCDACWGTASHPLCYAMNFIALGLVVSKQQLPAWVRYPLAGMAVGIGVVEALDIGAIFSVFSAAFVAFHAFVTCERGAKGIVHAGLRVGTIAVFAALIATSTLFTMIGTQIKGVVGTQQDEATKAAQWEKATWGSVPASELPAMIVPGVFGYRMMGFDEGQPPEEAYWGTAGRDGAWDRYFDSGKQGQPPRGGMIRWGSGGGYVGILIFIVACWTLLQSFRRENSVFSPTERKLIWFWAAIGVVGLLLSLGRYAPFYKWLYALPYVSTVRIPGKYLHVLNWSLLVMFAYGIYGLSRRCMDVSATTTRDLVAQWQAWWAKASVFDKRWVKVSWLVLVACAVGWMVYSSKRADLVAHLQDVQFDPARADAIASFSIGQTGIFVIFFAVALGLFTLTLSGYFSGKRVLVGVCLIAAFVVVDLTRVGSRWVATYNWKGRYLESADNDVIKFLKEKPYKGRVAIWPFGLPPQYQFVQQIYHGDWKQHIFQYYNIQTLDIIQMSRVPQEVAAFEGAMSSDGSKETIFRFARRWQLTNMRYLIAPAAAHSMLNTELDPGQRFRPLMFFEFLQEREGGPILARTNALDQTRPQFALFEFTGALPRVKLYSHWQVSTNDDATLTQLASREFDPEQTVLVAESIAPSPGGLTNTSPGTVEHTSYTPRRIELRARAESACVLLLNDKHDPTWKVYVDGKPAPMLRCNYVMRGVQLEKGEHTVEFRFEPSIRGLGVSIAVDVLGVALIGFVVLRWKRGEGAKETMAV